MDADKQKRRRIVPQQIQPSPVRPASEVALPDQEETGPSAQDLRLQSQKAEAILGPARKIYVKLLAESNKCTFINCKELLKIRAPKTNGKDAEDGKDTALPPPSKPMSALSRIIARLEQSIGLQADSDDSGSDEGEDNVSGSSSDEEAEPAAGPVAGGVSGTDGEGRKRRRRDNYDHFDDFIDDSEYIELIEDTDKRKLKHDGFFISKGEIERQEEYLPGFEAPERKRKKDPAASGKSGTASPGTARPSEDPSPGKKRAKSGEGGEPKRKSRSKEEGGGDKPKVPYAMPSDTRQCLQEVVRVASALPPPAVEPASAQEGEGGKQGKMRLRRIPAELQTELRRLAPFFIRDVGVFGSTAKKALLDALAPAMEPFASRPYLSQLLRRDPAEQGSSSQLPAAACPPPPKAPAPREAARDSVAQAAVRAAQGVGSAPVAEPSPEAQETGGVDPNAWKAVPNAVRERLCAMIRERLGGSELGSAAGKQVMSWAAAQFPAGSMDVAGIRKIMKQQREREERTRQKDAGGTPASAAALAAPRISPPAPGGASHTQLSPSEFARLATQRALSMMGASQQGSDSPNGAEAGSTPPAGSQPQSGTAGSGHAADSTFGEEPLPGAPLAEFFLQKGQEFGVPLPELQAILASTASSRFGSALAKLLMEVGPRGCTSAEALSGAVARGLLHPGREAPESRPNTLSQLHRAAGKGPFVHVGGYRYALRALPGIQEMPRPGKGSKSKAAGEEATT